MIVKGDLVPISFELSSTGLHAPRDSGVRFTKTIDDAEWTSALTRSRVPFAILSLFGLFFGLIRCHLLAWLFFAVRRRHRRHVYPGDEISGPAIRRLIRDSAVSFLADTRALLAWCLAFSTLRECDPSMPHNGTGTFVRKLEAPYFQDETGNTLEI